MAGAGFKDFANGDVLTADQVDTYLMQQTVMVFADASARTTALSGVIAEGMMSYLKDTNSVEYYSGSAWVAVSGGSSGGMTLLSTTPITATNSITVNTISGSYNELIVFVENFALNTTGNMQMRLNGDTGSNYCASQVQGQQGVINMTGAQTNFGTTQYSNLNGTNNASFILRIPFYAGTNAYKNGQYYGSATYGGTSSPVSWGGGIAYRSTSAISSITLMSAGEQFIAQGNIKIYGVN
jgi:hypothetical protein